MATPLKSLCHPTATKGVLKIKRYTGSGPGQKEGRETERDNVRPLGGTHENKTDKRIDNLKLIDIIKDVSF